MQILFFCLCFFFSLLIFLWHGVTLSSSHFPFSASFSLHRFQHTRNYLTVSLPFSHVCHRGQSLGFLSSSNTAVLHRDCNSSSACNLRPSVSQVIRPPPHSAEGEPPGHTLAYSLHVQSCAAGPCDRCSHTYGSGNTYHRSWNGLRMPWKARLWCDCEVN